MTNKVGCPKGYKQTPEHRAKHSLASIGKRKDTCHKGHSRLAANGSSQKEAGIACRTCYRENVWARQGILNELAQPFTVNDFNRHFQIQGGQCKICRRHQTEFKNALAADHDHSTGIFRGLLCPTCNLNVNHLTPDQIKAIATYLK